MYFGASKKCISCHDPRRGREGRGLQKQLVNNDDAADDDDDHDDDDR